MINALIGNIQYAIEAYKNFQDVAENLFDLAQEHRQLSLEYKYLLKVARAHGVPVDSPEFKEDQRVECMLDF